MTTDYPLLLLANKMRRVFLSVGVRVPMGLTTNVRARIMQSYTATAAARNLHVVDDVLNKIIFAKFIYTYQVQMRVTATAAGVSL